ncbi:hypothetical protein PFLUV_G00116380 [Perca fluviatilis]|uniref:Uncharacterized protein n=1 Tax=Perca fluviatilis TaxID=8168 RepID=A0A6A5F0M5_PERFL|nr:hypothetical protein PFLUV_G00116380 [Perca fluviatilis]
MQRSFTILYTSLLGMCLGSSSSFPSNINIGGLFPTDSHEYEVFRFALSHHQDIPKLVPQEKTMSQSAHQGSQAM